MINKKKIPITLIGHNANINSSIGTTRIHFADSKT